MHKCLFEYDGALRPAAVAYAVVSQLLDGMRGTRDLTARAGNEGLHPELEVLLLESLDKFAFVTAAQGGQLLHGALPLPEHVKVYDIMGNKLDLSAGVTFASSPLYLIGPENKMESCKSMLAALKLEPLVRFEARTEKDGDLDQFLLKVRIHNTGVFPLKGKVVMGEGRRNQWERPTAVTIEPGGSTLLLNHVLIRSNVKVI